MPAYFFEYVVVCLTNGFEKQIMTSISSKLEQFVREESEKRGFCLVALSIRGKRTLTVEIVLDKPGGISLDECGEFNRFLNYWLESEDLLGQNFFVDICSPGLDRALKETPDFLWAKGREVIVSLREPLNEKRSFTGKLTDVDGDDSITLDVEKENIVIGRELISLAKLWHGENVKKKRKRKDTKRSKKKK